MRPVEDREGRRPGRRSVAWVRAAVILSGVLLVDRLTKHAVESSIVRGEERQLLPGVHLVNTRNRGVAFGLLPNSQTAVTIVIIMALLVLLLYFARHSSKRLIWLPTGMLVGGALGNITDRIRAGSVTDFIKLPLGWPPFNLADASITLGILILLLLVDHSRRADP